MTEEARQARNRYYKEYRKKNAEKIRQIKENYWQRKADQMKQQEEQTG